MLAFESVPLDRKEASSASKVIDHLYRKHADASGLSVSVQGTVVVLSGVTVNILVHALKEVAEGHAVTLGPAATGPAVEPQPPAEMSTTEAAELLDISRPTLMKLIESGVLGYRMVGNRHKVLRNEVLAYKRQMYVKREKVLNELTADAQAMGLYDDPV